MTNLIRTISRIQELTSDNDHSNAVVVLAELTKNERLIKRARRCEVDHILCGELTIENNTHRQFTYKQALAIVKRMFGEDAANQIKNSF